MKERKPAPTDRERLTEYETRTRSLQDLAGLYQRQAEQLREKLERAERDDGEPSARR
jgi:hypothetical protein